MRLGLFFFLYYRSILNTKTDGMVRCLVSSEGVLLKNDTHCCITSIVYKTKIKLIFVEFNTSSSKQKVVLYSLKHPDILFTIICKYSNH